MATRIGLVGVPIAAVIGMVLLLNALDASVGIAGAVLGLVAVVSGATFGYFSDRLPELPRARRTRRLVPHVD
jgi:drug/metabolite transporter (DMT)-like permease